MRLGLPLPSGGQSIIPKLMMKSAERELSARRLLHIARDIVRIGAQESCPDHICKIMAQSVWTGDAMSAQRHGDGLKVTKTECAVCAMRCRRHIGILRSPHKVVNRRTISVFEWFSVCNLSEYFFLQGGKFRHCISFL